MRVLHLDSEKTWRGGENQVRYLIKGLNQKGVQQWAAAPEKSVAIQERRWDCPLIGLPSGNPMDFRSWLKLISVIRENKIQILDAHSAKAHTLALHVARFLPDLKIVVHRRVDNAIGTNFLTRRKYFHPRVNRFVAISGAIADLLKKYGVAEKNVSVVKSAVDATVYDQYQRLSAKDELRQKWGFPQGKVLIGNASALSPQKGYETLLHSVYELSKMGVQNFQVYIAGTGELEPSLKQMVQNLKIEDRVVFLGFIQNVSEFLATLDVLAIPSKNEGLGTVILDAILAGCCPVGSRVGGIPEIIIHNQTGLLIEPGDHKTLSQHLKSVIENPDLRARLAQAANQHVRQNFGLEAMVEGNYQVYRELVG